jgi:hypothetical protein
VRHALLNSSEARAFACCSRRTGLFAYSDAGIFLFGVAGMDVTERWRHENQCLFLHNYIYYQRCFSGNISRIRCSDFNLGSEFPVCSNFREEPLRNSFEMSSAVIPWIDLIGSRLTTTSLDDDQAKWHYAYTFTIRSSI